MDAAALGRRAAWVSAGTLMLVVLLNVGSASWAFFALMLVVMTFLFGFRHPRIHDEEVPLDSRRRTVAILAALIFLVCFTPVPIDTVGGGVAAGRSVKAVFSGVANPVISAEHLDTPLTYEA